jgi:tetratricopeptide (TPR) repeat protein
MLASLSRPNSPQQEYHYNKAKELVKDKNSKRFVSLLDTPTKNGNRTIFGRQDKSKVWDLMMTDAQNGPFIQFYHAWSRNDLDNRIKTLKNLLETRVSEGESDNGYIANFLGYSYVQAEKLDKAKSTFEDYIAKNSERYDSLAEFYLNQKEYEKAKENYQKH